MMTAGFCADSMIELFFRNVKGVKASRWCTPGTTYSRSFVLTRMFSAELRRAMLYETLDRHFTFVDVRMADICNELQKLINAQKFMDDDPFDKEKYKQSTYQRWSAQVSECVLHGIGTLRSASDWSDSTVYTCQETWRRRFHHSRSCPYLC